MPGRALSRPTIWGVSRLVRNSRKTFEGWRSFRVDTIEKCLPLIRASQPSSLVGTAGRNRGGRNKDQTLPTPWCLSHLMKLMHASSQSYSPIYAVCLSLKLAWYQYAAMQIFCKYGHCIKKFFILYCLWLGKNRNRLRVENQTKLYRNQNCNSTVSELKLV